jgi:hypothetical protein
MTMDEPSLPAGRRPARITKRFRLGGTAGPVEHLKIGCVDHHWLPRWPRPSPCPARPHPGSHPARARVSLS